MTYESLKSLTYQELKELREAVRVQMIKLQDKAERKFLQVRKVVAKEIQP